MQYSTERLGRLIHNLSSTPTLISYENPNEKDATDLKQSILMEIDNMQMYLDRQAISIEDFKPFKLLLRQYQIFITGWMDKIYPFMGEFVKADDSVLILVILELRKYLEDIQDKYHHFFCFDEKAPRIFIDEFIRKTKRKYPSLARKLLMEKVTHECAEMALSPLKDFMSQGHRKRTTFQKLEYLQKYEKELLKFKNNKACLFKDRALMDLMFYMNYNSVGMVQFVIDRMKEGLKSVNNNDEYLVKLHLYLKEVNNIEDQSLSFNEKAKSLKEQVSYWIKEEIDYHKIKISITQNSDQIRIPNELFKKVEIGPSVEVFSLIIRAAKDEKVVRNTNGTEVYKNISKYFRTRYTDTISVKSLVNKSYTLDSNAKEKAVKILENMIKWIRTYKV